MQSELFSLGFLRRSAHIAYTPNAVVTETIHPPLLNNSNLRRLTSSSQRQHGLREREKPQDDLNS
jgi:hypothetical protein